MRWDKSLFQFLTLTVQGADANTTFFIQFGVSRDRSVVGEWLGFSSSLRLQVASRDLASQPCLGPSSSPPPQPPLSQRQGWVSGVCQGDPCSLRGGWLEHSSTSSDVGFTTSPLPTPAPRRPAFSLATGPFGRKETGPAKAKDSGAPPSERLLRQWLCPVPYHPWGEAVWPEDWNLNAIVFDIVTFPLGRVNPPSRSFAPSHVCQLPPVLAFFHTPAGEC